MIWFFLFLGIIYAFPMYFIEARDSGGNNVLSRVNRSDNIYATGGSNYWVNGTYTLPIYSTTQVDQVLAGCEFSGISTSFWFISRVSLEWFNRTSNTWQQVCSVTVLLRTNDQWLVCNVTPQYYYDIENFQDLSGTTMYLRCNMRSLFGSGTSRIDALLTDAQASICGVVNTPGNYIMVRDIYGATQNVSTPFPGKACIIINSSNVHVDCQGYTTSDVGTPGTTYGIWVNNKNNISFRNCNITNYTYNMMYDNFSSNITLINNSYNLSDGADIGLNWFTEGVWIENSTFDRSQHGIYLINNVRNVTSIGNLFINGNTGIRMYQSNDTLIQRDRYFRLTGKGFTGTLVNNLLINLSRYSDVGLMGIEVRESQNISINTSTTDTSPYGVVLVNTNNFTILNTRHASHDVGINIRGSSNGFVNNSGITSISTGVIVENSSNISLDHLDISRIGKYGIGLQNNFDTIIINNSRIYDGNPDYGIMVDSNGNNITLENLILYNIITPIMFNWNIYNISANGISISRFTQHGMQFANAVYDGYFANISISLGDVSSDGISMYNSRNHYFDNITITGTGTGVIANSIVNVTFNNSNIFNIPGSCIYLQGINRFYLDYSNVSQCYRGLYAESSNRIYPTNSQFFDNTQAVFVNNSRRFIARRNLFYNNLDFHCNFTNSYWITLRTSNRLYNSSLGCAFENTTLIRLTRTYFYNHTKTTVFQNSTGTIRSSLLQNTSIGVYSNNSYVNFTNSRIYDFSQAILFYGSNSTSQNLRTYYGGVAWNVYDSIIETNVSRIQDVITAHYLRNTSGYINNFTELGGIVWSLFLDNSSLSIENSTISRGTIHNSNFNIFQTNFTTLDILNSQNSQITYSNISQLVIRNSTNFFIEYLLSNSTSLEFVSDSSLLNSTFTGGSTGLLLQFSNNVDVIDNLIENNTEGAFIVSGGLHNGKFLGMSYVSWNNYFPTENLTKDLNRISHLGTNQINLVVQLRQSTNTSSDVQLLPGTSLAHLGTVVTTIKNKGYRVCIYPLLTTNTGQWRGDILPSDLNTWFSNYGNILTNLASLNPDCLYVGSEYVQFQNESSRWSNLVNNLRSSYSGELYYGFNWYDSLFQYSYENLTWLSLLDGLGISMYAPLAPCSNPYDLTTFSNYIDNVLYPNISRMHNITNKPIHFSEIGFRSTNNAYCRPYDWTYSSNIQNFTRQAQLHSLWYNKMKSWPDWFQGEVIWYYETPGVYRWDGYSIIDKPAEYSLQYDVAIGNSTDGALLLIDKGSSRNYLSAYNWMFQTQDSTQTFITQKYLKWETWVDFLEPDGRLSLSYDNDVGDTHQFDLSIENKTHLKLEYYINSVLQSTHYVPYQASYHNYTFEVNYNTFNLYIDGNPKFTLTVSPPYRMNSFQYVSSWDYNVKTSILIYNTFLWLKNPDTSQIYLAYYHNLMDAIYGYMYYGESETPRDPNAGETFVSYYNFANRPEKHLLGLNVSGISNTFYNNSICFNTFDAYSHLFNFTNGLADRCDIFGNWQELGRPGCTKTCSEAWHRFYGDLNKTIVLAAQGDTGYLKSWLATFENGTVFMTDTDSIIHWDRLVALTRDSSNTFVPGNLDFAEADSALSLNSYPARERITTLWGGSDPSNPLATDTFNVLGTYITGVPIVSSAPANTTFVTGILWDSFYNSQYTGLEPLVFATKVNKDTIDLYGTYDYLIMVPETLGQLEGTNDLVAVYVYLE